MLREIVLHQKEVFSFQNHFGMKENVYERAAGLLGQVKRCENSPANDRDPSRVVLYVKRVLLSWSFPVRVKAVSFQAFLLTDPLFIFMQGHHTYLPV